MIVHEPEAQMLSDRFSKDKSRNTTTTVPRATAAPRALAVDALVPRTPRTPPYPARIASFSRFSASMRSFSSLSRLSRSSFSRLSFSLCSARASSSARLRSASSASRRFCSSMALSWTCHKHLIATFRIRIRSSPLPRLAIVRRI